MLPPGGMDSGSVFIISSSKPISQPLTAKMLAPM